jgi:hypothetical protein
MATSEARRDYLNRPPFIYRGNSMGSRRFTRQGVCLCKST